MGKNSRWWDSLGNRLNWDKQLKAVCPLQGSKENSGIPEPIARLVYEEYSAHYGTTQSFDRIQERGGFGVTEVIAALADIIERERSNGTDGSSEGSSRKAK